MYMLQCLANFQKSKKRNVSQNMAHASAKHTKFVAQSEVKIVSGFWAGFKFKCGNNRGLIAALRLFHSFDPIKQF